MESPGSSRGAPRRKALGRWTAIALVVGNMVGAGAYLVPATLGDVGPIALFGWLVTGTGVMCLAAAFSRMGRIMPAEGGPYAYTKEAFGPLAGFLVAWGYWVSAWIGNAAISTAMVASFTPFFPVLGDSPVSMATTSLGVLWLLTLLNVRGVREAAIFQLVTTILKVTPLILFATIGLAYIDVGSLTPLNVSGGSGGRAIAGASVLLLWGLLGFESATVPAEEVENPTVEIPRATLGGTAATTGIYALSMLAIMGILTPAELEGSAAPFVDGAARVWGPAVATVVAAGAALASVGVLNGWILMQGQIAIAPARDGVFPSAFGRLSERGSPAFGLILSSLLCTVLVASNYTRGLLPLFEFALLLATVTVVVGYAGSVLAHIVLITREPERWAGRDAGRARVFSGLGFTFCVFVMVWSGWEANLWGAALFVVGLPVYALSVRAKSKQEAR